MWLLGGFLIRDTTFSRYHGHLLDVVASPPFDQHLLGLAAHPNAVPWAVAWARCADALAVGTSGHWGQRSRTASHQPGRQGGGNSSREGSQGGDFVGHGAGWDQHPRMYVPRPQFEINRTLPFNWARTPLCVCVLPLRGVCNGFPGEGAPPPKGSCVLPLAVLGSSGLGSLDRVARPRAP